MPYLTESEQDEALAAMLSAIHREALGDASGAPFMWEQTSIQIREAWVQVAQFVRTSQHSVDQIKQALAPNINAFDLYEGIVSNETKHIIEWSPSQWLEQLRKKKVWDQDRFTNRDDQLEG